MAGTPALYAAAAPYNAAMGLASRITVLTAACAVLTLAGCSSSWNMAPGWPPLDVSGIYHSSAAVGSLGVLSLELERVEQSRVFNAKLSSTDNPDLGETKGVGTLGDVHLILNFGRGSKDDYYFEGVVATTGSTVESINGEFIFPDQAEPLPVVFQ
jgi:hypothetical protein